MGAPFVRRRAEFRLTDPVSIAVDVLPVVAAPVTGVSGW